MATGFEQIHLDYSLLIKKSSVGIVIVLIYVDDLLVSGSNTEMIDDTKKILKTTSRLKTSEH